MTTILEEKKVDTSYKAPAKTQIGHVHLKVSDLERSLSFYKDLLGFEVTTKYGDQAVFLSAGGYHHHIGLNTWHSKDAPPAPKHGNGLYHAAILYPERKDLAIILQRLNDAKYPVNGASDHGVSEAIYLRDPDNNGIELYWDKPIDAWPKDENGELDMHTKPLNIQSLMSVLN
ncbi:VOC family protein [Ekhidna lutea]|nr:VOC family protein [Ekhidna lutea]